MNEDLTAFMQTYEQANNSHIWANVVPMISDNGIYWFTDSMTQSGEDRGTDILEKRNNSWQIVHEHLSN